MPNSKRKQGNNTPETMRCMCCGNELKLKEFYSSNSKFYSATGKIPYCKECIGEFYKDYNRKYNAAGYDSPDKKAIEKICMMFDIYYSDKIFNSAKKLFDDNPSAPLFALYFKQVNLYQYQKKNYDTTVNEKFEKAKSESISFTMINEDDFKKSDDIKSAIEIFGTGFDNDDYVFLYEQYCDWITRHECNTKSQEEVFKRLCFTQLELSKATKAGKDTEKLNATFLKQLDAAKLQPKQNSNEAVSDAQTFGTLIDKWENTRPIPEPDPELADVDKIGLYIDVFFRGHLARMMKLKNGLSNLYDKFIKKYTVEKPEYDDDEDNEVLFDAIFGASSLDDGDS